MVGTRRRVRVAMVVTVPMGRRAISARPLASRTFLLGLQRCRQRRHQKAPIPLRFRSWHRAEHRDGCHFRRCPEMGRLGMMSLPRRRVSGSGLNSGYLGQTHQRPTRLSRRLHHRRHPGRGQEARAARHLPRHSTIVSMDIVCRPVRYTVPYVVHHAGLTHHIRRTHRARRRHDALVGYNLSARRPGHSVAGPELCNRVNE